MASVRRSTLSWLRSALLGCCGGCCGCWSPSAPPQRGAAPSYSALPNEFLFPDFACIAAPTPGQVNEGDCCCSEEEEDELDVDDLPLSEAIEARGPVRPWRPVDDLLREGPTKVTALRLHDFPDFQPWPRALDLATLAPALRVLSLTHCRLGSLYDADLVLPPALHTLVLAYSNVRDFEVALPRTLRRLDLSFNYLERLPACLEGIRDLVIHAGAPSATTRRRDRTCALDLRNNEFWFAKYSNLPLGRVSLETIVELARANEWGLLSTASLHEAMRHVGLAGPAAAHVMQTRVTRLKRTYENAQSVHIPAVQRSVRDVVTRLEAFCEASAQDFDPAFVGKLVKNMQMTREHEVIFRQDCSRPEAHGALGTTFGRLCHMLMAFVDAQENASEIYEVMGREYAANAKVCFTGKVTHLLGALNGLVPGFAVGIDARTELADKMASIRNAWSARAAGLEDYVRNAVPEAMQALEDACVPEAEQGPWLDAI